MAPTMRIAACHASPVFLSASATTQKAISFIRTAAHNDANLVVFPETYIPAFPIWSSVRAPAKNHDIFARMAAESIYADGEEVGAIRDVARQRGITVSVGFSEKVRYSSATLFNSNLVIGADGEVLVHHRKLMPTFYEKLTWSPGDGHGLRVFEIEKGGTGAKVGVLICGENTNPLARYSLMAQGEQVHISTWPAIWPTRMPEGASAAPGTRGANYDNVSANKTRAAAHCFEAKAFGVLCSGFLDQTVQDTLLPLSDQDASITGTIEKSSRGATMFLNPQGTQIQGFVIDPTTGEKKPRDMLQTEEGILYVDLDLAEGIEGKQYHDVVGGYQRLDVFDLQVDRRRREPVNFVNDK